MSIAAWGILLIAATLEVVWATAITMSDGFTQRWPTIIGVAAAIASFVLLGLALRTLPVGTAYAVWVGLGLAGVAVVGIAAFDESAAPARVLCFALIIVGVTGLKVLDG